MTSGLTITDRGASSPAPVWSRSSIRLTLPIRRETLQGKTVFFVDDNALVACFDQGISEELVKELAKTLTTASGEDIAKALS